jgi:hypothetical protein
LIKSLVFTAILNAIFFSKLLIYFLIAGSCALSMPVSRINEING